MKTLSRRSLLALGATAPLAARCSALQQDTFDRNAMLGAIADNVLVPLAAEVDATQRALATAATAFATEPTRETLAAGRAAWRSARVPLERAQAFSAGPFESLGLRSIIDWYPSSGAAIERLLAATTPISATDLEIVGANQRGMPAIEYLLFAADEAATLAACTTGADAARRRALVRSAAELSSQRATQFSAAWSRATGDYAGELERAGRGSAAFATTRAAVDLLVNQLINALETALVRFSVPLGASSGGTPQPDRAESPFSDNSIADARARLEGVDAVYLGRLGARSGTGLRDLVLARISGFDPIVRARADAAFAAIDRIPTTLRVAVVQHAALVQAAADAIREWRRAVQTDISAALGVTVTFTDGDGD